MSRAKHEGLPLEEYIAPISHRFLIPVFFVALGLQIEWRWLIGWTALPAIGSAGPLLGTREILHRRWLKSGGDHRAFLLLCPNLTIVALATKAMLDYGAEPKLTAWLVLTGLFMTIPSLLLLPSGTREHSGAPVIGGPAENDQPAETAATTVLRNKTAP